MTLWPLIRPLSGNVTLPTPVYILLRILTYHIGIADLRKKGVGLHKKTKEINILRKSTVSFRIMTLWPLMRPISGNVTLPTPVRILLGILTYHIGIVNLRK